MQLDLARLDLGQIKDIADDAPPVGDASPVNNTLMTSDDAI